MYCLNLTVIQQTVTVHLRLHLPVTSLSSVCLAHQTALPALVHDSIMFTNIESPVVKKLIELYSKETKQIFIAYDHIDKADIDLQELLQKNKVLELSDEPYCLFGKQWNKKPTQESN